MSLYRYGEAVYYYHDDALVGKFYMASIKRVGKYNFEISCTSAIGLLDGVTHYGGLYSGELAGAVLADIIGGVVAYTVDPLFAAVPVYGWLPVGTRRANLHQLMFAVGGSLKKSAAGVINITFLDSKSPYDISDDRLGMGGSVDYQTPVSGVAVTEHGYGTFATDEEATLYDGQLHAETIVTPKGATVSGVLVTFSDPAHDLSVMDGTILESGVNYAVLGGSYATLTGKKHTHTTRVITRMVGDGTDNMARVEDATLVSLVNSGNVADRLLSYYSAARIIRADMVMGQERPGDAVVFNDPFDERTDGIVQSQDINISNTLLASAKIVCGYLPSGGGNNFGHVEVIGTERTWVVPKGVSKIRAVLISGGTGGYGGEKGENGKSGASSFGSGQTYTWSDYAYGLAGGGGKSGVGGPGGKVREIDLDVTPGQTFTVKPGVGGIGGVCTGVSIMGASGTDTVFGGYSSKDGSIYEHGYTEMFSGMVYARPGNASGVTGGTGSGADSGGFDITPGSAIRGPGGELWGPGGVGNDRAGSGHGILVTSRGGPGGGAAYGVSGNSGGTGETWNSSSSSGAYRVHAVGGPGGQGAKPIAQTAQSVYGCGGDGGHGGGGGGGGGATGIQYNTGMSVTVENNPGPGGSGGLGGDGGWGGPGCVIIYY